MQSTKTRYAVRRLDEVELFRSVCGFRQSIITHADSKELSLSYLHITDFARKHYHKQTTEIYYVLEGTGEMELDDETVEMLPGTCVLIEPGCRHTARGDLKVIIIGVPPFREADVHYDE